MFGWLTWVKQCFDTLGSKLADYMKCKSNCCNNINVYNPRKCVILSDTSNRWVRAITPDCVKDALRIGDADCCITKSKTGESDFYTPKS